MLCAALSVEENVRCHCSHGIHKIVMDTGNGRESEAGCVAGDIEVEAIIRRSVDPSGRDKARYSMGCICEQRGDWTVENVHSARTRCGEV